VISGEVILVIARMVSPVLRERWVTWGIIDWLLIESSEDEIYGALQRIRRRLQKPEFELADTVTAITGVIWTDDKLGQIETRLTRRMIDLQLSRQGGSAILTYLEYFRANRQNEIPVLVSLLTTHTTEFFRDTRHFDYLVSTHLREKIIRGQKIRIWSAACSTGEEAYSIAMAIWDESRRLHAPLPQLEIIGTDIDDRAVKQAAQGIFHEDLVSRISPSIRQEYLLRGHGDLSRYYRLRDDVWQQCSFARGNLLDGVVPDGKFDAIFVRNVFIYFEPDDVVRVAKGMASALLSGGMIYIGASETLDRKATGLVARAEAIYGLAAEIRSPSSLREANPLERSGFTRVLVVDDSPSLRAMLKKILSSEFGFEVVGEASDPLQAIELLKTRSVDVVTLDIHMPRMDGASYLRSIQGMEHPPVVVISSISEREARDVFFCIDLGASDFVQKPEGLNLLREAEAIRQSVRAAALQKPRLFGPATRAKARNGGSEKVSSVGPLVTAGGIQYSPPAADSLCSDYILVGASTGGIDAIRSLLAQFPTQCPPVVIVQHIPPLFSRLFAERLNDVSRVKVKEAAQGMVLEKNTIYVAPGGYQLGFIRQIDKLVVELSQESHPSLHRPSVDYAFEAFLKVVNPRRYLIAAALLTGMGKDGAKSLLEIWKSGYHTIAQDEGTSVVYGMPKAAVDIGAAVEELPLESIPYHLFQSLLRAREKARKAS
jgi:two-component system chemotaxis response regulator CheB